MKDNIVVKELLFTIMEQFQEMGFDLSSDSVTLDLTYPEIPHISITLKVGGMFPSANLEEEETIH